MSDGNFNNPGSVSPADQDRGDRNHTITPSTS
jgi:hypothetical protein